ncbi:2-oxo acid dehydrogenase subunit E2 [Microbacterium sp. KUDC0406]|uniref:2-oxo acid dehydrogenase subunit E2 n=1 Tax=Microbacterium sp. KUDC0406 TaxID=2909588 RepID=UPI001F3A6F7B|nr:2-oxo acid dehydrogenase subunit E2 [Microbacterium sp. KUDC0406]UJP09960.1 2-oxo acid dehydrogenase subunit E2 [Microbacterium sp. KUDC0406]
MMATEVKVPTTGNAGEDAVVLDWNVAVGDDVRVGDVLCSLETAKAVVEVEAPAAGTLLEIRYAEGDDAPEHAVLAMIGEPGEGVTPQAPASSRSAAPTPESATSAPNPAARAAGPARNARPGRIYASPRAKIIAAERDVDLTTLEGSGPFGRIVIRDVVAAADARRAHPAELAVVSGPAVEATTPSPTGGEPVPIEVLPVRGARKVTAQRMHASLAHTAQVTLTRYADADALLRYSARLKVAAEDGRRRIAVNDLLLFAVARTLPRHPALNSWFDWDGIRRFEQVNLGFAVDTEQALYVPVIEHAETLGLADLAGRAQGAIEKARAGRLTPDDMSGGTFTVSNLGGLGIHWFTPVLNPPQSGILGVGAAHRSHADAPALLPLSLTFDHRALDGAGGSRRPRRHRTRDRVHRHSRGVLTAGDRRKTMAKELLIDPATVNATGRLELGSIDVNVYTSDLAAERASYGDDAVRRIGRDMVLVREFEQMLNSIKREANYLGVDYVHAGPAHLSIGQEAQAVGQAFTLGVGDRVFGSHRSHGEVIAKGLSAIAQSARDDLFRSFESWAEGETWEVVRDRLASDDPERLAINYLMYGMTAETFGRRTGFNRGLGGSMHAFFPPLGIYPNNAIVGGSAPLATGAALYNRVRRAPGIAVASIGDASTGTGPVWESMGFAAQAQFRTLFDEAHRGGLPVVFFIVNNFYGMGGQPIGETMSFERLARIGSGVNAERMHVQTINGNDPFAVIDAMRTARRHIEDGAGPVLIDCQTYRLSGHSPSDASSYRTKEELDLWTATDPIQTHYRRMAESGIADVAAYESDLAWAQGVLRPVLEAAIDTAVSPRLGLRADPAVMAGVTFNNTSIDDEDAAPVPPGETTVPLAELPHHQAIAKKSRTGIADGKVLSGARAVTFRDALFEAITEATERDDRITLWGEENRDWGGSFGVYRGLTEFLPRHRLFNAPISEAAIVGTGVGFALAGGRPLVELMYADFIGRAGDEIFNQMAKWQPMSGGLAAVPMVLRVSVGAKYGAQHSQDWSSMVAGVPGLKVVFPATARDAKGLLTAALRGNDPVVFFESQRLYDLPETVHPEGVPAGEHITPIGEPNIVREGTDLTIMTVGATLYRALEAAERLQTENGLSVEVIDARSLVPFNYDLLLASVEKTGRLLLASDASLRGSWLNTVAATVQTQSFDHLDAPVTVLGARNWIAPPAELEWEYFVTPDDIIDAVHTRILPLPGHVTRDVPGAEGTLAESARGI